MSMISLRSRSRSEGDSPFFRLRKAFRTKGTADTTTTNKPNEHDDDAKRQPAVANGTTLLVGELKEDSVHIHLPVVGSETEGASKLTLPSDCPLVVSNESTPKINKVSTISLPDEELAQVQSQASTEYTEGIDPGLRKPLAGSSTRRIETIDQIDFDKSAESLIAWRRVSCEKLRVRSANYRRNKIKQPSSGELYECLYVDFVESPERIPNISDHVHIPHLQEQSENAPWSAPDIFVVSLSLPAMPVLGKDGGPTYTIVMYYRMKAETRDILEHLYSTETVRDQEMAQHPMYNAVRLFDQWCLRSSEDDPKFMGRFKLITSADNLEEMGLPKWIASWNGKPVLIKRSGTTGFLYQKPSCMEFEVTFHPFPWATKKAIQYMRDQAFHLALVNFGFVIEGRDDSELPEVLVGLCQLCYPNAEQAVHSETFFGHSG